MGTRSLTVFMDELGEEIAVLYRQFDGYPSCHGVELARCLSGKVIVNGIPSDKREEEMINGMNSVPIVVIASLRKINPGIGNFYLFKAGTRDRGEEYIYTIRFANHGAEVTIEVDGCEIQGPLDPTNCLMAWEEKQEEEVR